VLPGIGPLAAMSLLLPATAVLNPVASMSMLCALFYGAMYGGSTTSILVRIPGEAASLVTCLDGHEMAKKGRAGAALGMAAIGSFIAGTLSLVALTFFSPLLSEFALKFGPPENAALMLLGLVCTILLIEGSALKGLVMIGLGAFLASIGQDSVTGTERFTFGSVNLVAGVDLIALVIGLFGISEILSNIETTLRNRIATGRLGRLLPTARDWRDSAAPMLRGSGLGFALGLIPGGGPVTASFMSYAVEKRLSRHPERFGTGEIAGLAGPEAANNSAVSAGMIPLLSLGLPGNAVTALLMGALIMQGRAAGPALHCAEAGYLLGRRRQHVCRQRLPADPQPAADRIVGAVAAGALPPPIPDHHPLVARRRVLGEQEHLRPLGHARLSACSATSCGSSATRWRPSSWRSCSRRSSSRRSGSPW
jgi:putative tricarboxylic transport membrane protein